MKNTDMFYWVGTTNAIKQQAEEIVLNELIYKWNFKNYGNIIKNVILS